MASFSSYQQQYMEQRLGSDWRTNANSIQKTNFVEQTAFCSFIYAGVMWLFN